jgi:Putative DNA-binding domain
MLNKRPEDVTFADVQSLVDTQQQEGYQLDYKVDIALPLKGEDKKEFLRDVTSFANTYGGYLILGVEENKGVPTGNIPGLAIDNFDRFKRDIETIIRDSIEPRLFAHTIREFKLDSGRYLIVLHIPRSWNPPHRGLGDQFYNRHSAGKSPLGVEQLRRVFTQGADNLERIRRFVRERAFLVHTGDGPISLSPNTPKVIVHVIPLISFEGAISLPIGKALLQSMDSMRPIDGEWGWDRSFNADGMMWGLSETNNDSTTKGHYTQLFRNGIFESAENRMARIIEEHKSTYGMIPATRIEKEVCENLFYIFRELQTMDVTSPLFVNLTLMGVKGYTVPSPSGYFGYSKTIPHDYLFFPEVTFEEFASYLGDNSEKSSPRIALKLKQIFDALWQSSGYAGSPNFNGDQWNPRS